MWSAKLVSRWRDDAKKNQRLQQSLPSRHHRRRVPYDRSLNTGSLNMAAELPWTSPSPPCDSLGRRTLLALSKGANHHPAVSLFMDCLVESLSRLVVTAASRPAWWAKVAALIFLRFLIFIMGPTGSTVNKWWWWWQRRRQRLSGSASPRREPADANLTNAGKLPPGVLASGATMVAIKRSSEELNSWTLKIHEYNYKVGIIIIT